MVRATKQTLLKEDVTREYTIHLHKYIHSVVFKKSLGKRLPSWLFASK